MDGKSIRRMAWNEIKGKRAAIAGVWLLSMLPGLIFRVVQRILDLYDLPLPAWCGYTVHLIEIFLSLCFTGFLIGLVKEKKEGLKDFCFPFQKKQFKKAVLVCLFLFAIPFLINLPLNWLSGYGAKLMAAAKGPEREHWGRMIRMVEDAGLYRTGTILAMSGIAISLAAGCIVKALLFPIQFLFILFPGERASQLLKKGVGLGYREFWGIVVFAFWVSILPIVGYLFFIIIFAGIPSLFMFAVIFVLIPAAVFYCTYMELALTMFAVRLIEADEAELPPPPPRRRMKLIHRDGWCYYDMKSGHGSKGHMAVLKE